LTELFSQVLKNKLVGVSGVIHNKVCHDFPGETFRVLKDKEKREFGEYHTRHLFLKAWDINKPSLPWVLLINKVAD